MISIHIVGCGGIGSYLCEEVSRLIKTQQLREVAVTLWDGDDVEVKNLSYQNFTEKDVYVNKASVLGAKYNFSTVEARIEDFDQISNATIIILCVDNVDTRKAFFSSKLFENVQWIDLRSQGRAVAYYCSSKISTREFMLATLPEKQEEGTGSCQYAADVIANKIENGNKIIAAIGAQVLLNLVRKERLVSSYVHEF